MAIRMTAKQQAQTGSQKTIKEVDVMYKEKLDAYIDAHKEDMLEDLKTLVRINSQKGESQQGKPFGEGPAKVLDTAEEMLKKYGFSTQNYDCLLYTSDAADDA